MDRWRAAIAVGAAFGVATMAIARDPKVGEAAPAFTLRTVDGQTVSLADLRGQVVVLNFWATWCAPCKRELPALDSFYSIVKDHGLRVFAITTEDSVPIDQLKKLFAVLHIPSVKVSADLIGRWKAYRPIT